MPKKPVWVKGTPFPLECAIWNWATFLIDHGKRGTHQAYIDNMTKLHGQEIEVLANVWSFQAFPKVRLVMPFLSLLYENVIDI